MRLMKAWNIDEVKLKLKEEFIDYELNTEYVHITKAVDRVLAEDIFADADVPHFRRSTVDGYALISKDTYGANESMPMLLAVIGEVYMGRESNLKITSEHAVYVPTGGMVPLGSDAVAMVEYTEKIDENEIAVYRATAPGENMINIGDDINSGEKVLEIGTKVRPQDIGVLSSIGIQQVKVYSKPRVAIISTGDEIIDPEEELKPGVIRDINTFTLSAMAERLGCMITKKVVIRDEIVKLQEILEQSMYEDDIIIISGGSSVGTKDITAEVINSVGKPGVLIHGVAIKPGKPTIIGKINNKPVFGLPGQPVSAMIVFKVIVEHFIKNLMGLEEMEGYIEATLSTNIHSTQGRETYQMVTLEKEGNGYIAIPIYGKSGMITLMSKAKGYIKIDANTEGLNVGEKVRVFLF